MKSNLYSGQKIGNITLLEKYVEADKKSYWKCSCECGELLRVKLTTLTANLRVNAKMVYCKCNRGQLFGPNHKNWRGVGQIRRSYFDMIKHGAETRGIDFSITIEDVWSKFIKQDGKCVLTGLSLFLNESKRRPTCEQTASLDRKDSTKGYTLDNIQWIHKDISRMKNHYSEDIFKNYCKLVVEHLGL